MSKILHVDDLIKPSMGSALSVKPIIDSYILRYNQFAAKDIKIYSIPDKNNYVVHVMVPSENNKNYEKPIFYDVVFEFYTTSKDDLESSSFKNYGIKVFSNSITWMFDFTYVFKKSNNIPSFIPDSYCSKIALKNPPKKTNPFGIYGIERIVFIALYHLENITGYRKSRLLLIDLPKATTKDIVKSLMSQEEKLDQLNLERKKEKIAKQKAKIKNANNINIINKKEKNIDKLTDTLDKNFDANLKSNMNSDTKSSKLKSNFKSNLSKKK